MADSRINFARSGLPRDGTHRLIILIFSSRYLEFYHLKFLKVNDIETFLNKEQTRWLTMQENFVEIFSETRQGKSLWKFFLIAAIIFLLLETMIGRPEPLKMKSNEE